MDIKNVAERMKTDLGIRVEQKAFGRTHRVALELSASDLPRGASWLRNDEQCRMDWVELASCWKAPKGLVVTYFIRSRLSGEEMILRSRVSAGEAIPALAGVWSTAHPFEKEFIRAGAETDV